MGSLLDIFETGLDASKELKPRLDVKFLESGKGFLVVSLTMPNSIYFLYGNKLIELMRVMDHYVSMSPFEEYEDPKEIKVMFRGYEDKQEIINKLQSFVKLLQEKFGVQQGN